MNTLTHITLPFTITITLHRDTHLPNELNCPTAPTIQQWVNQLVAVMQTHLDPNTPIAQYLKKHPHLTVGVQCVSKARSAQLNDQYRQHNYPTNILSFPYWKEDHGNGSLSVDVLTSANDARLHQENTMSPSINLGDLACCAAIIEEEAVADRITPKAHWAHLIVHGLLHLLGYDHITPADADLMESLEVQILEKLGYSNPYEEVL